MTTTTALLTNKAYGYPTRGARRRRKPTILACLHQTANAKATAIQERTYANRAGSWGPSATAYIDRDGTVMGFDVEAFGAMADAVSIPVIAAGGLATVDDIVKLKARKGVPVAGAVLGRALYNGAINPAEALGIAA